MKICIDCKLELPYSRFYFFGKYNKKGGKIFSSYCRECHSIRVKPDRKNSYKPRQNKDIREDILIDNKEIYILIKKIELNHLKMSYIDSFRLVNEYVKVFGDDISDYYSETDQLDIMFFKLSRYIDKPL